MTLGERIKKVRKALDLTQQKFAEQIGTTQNNIASYEIGRREPSAAAINNICKTFSISETWLRTGEGEMFVQRSEDDELAAAVERLMTGSSSDFKRRLVNVLSSLKEDQWIVLQEKLEEIIGVRDTPSVPVPSASAEAEALYESSLSYARNTSSSASSTTGDTGSSERLA